MQNRWDILMPQYNGIKLKHKYEMFVRIEGTTKFYVSTLGQIAVKKNNGRCRMISTKIGKVKVGFTGERRYRAVFVDKLVVDAFLVKVPGRNCIWHKDRNQLNNNYRNLMLVTKEDYIRLLRREISISNLDYVQYYFPAWAFNPRIQKQKYVDMVSRCQNRHYGIVCTFWKENPESFYRWMEEVSYPDAGCNYEIDKDILFPMGRVYSPETCCLIPKSLNLLFEISKNYIHKEHKHGEEKYWFIPPGSTTGRIYKSTKEEAKAEYLRLKVDFMKKRIEESKHMVTEKIYNAMQDYVKVLWLIYR